MDEALSGISFSTKILAMNALIGSTKRHLTNEHIGIKFPLKGIKMANFSKKKSVFSVTDFIILLRMNSAH